MQFINAITKLLTKKIGYRPDPLQQQFTWHNASLMMGVC